MSDVALGRFNRWIEKFFNAKGGPTTVDVGGTILPVMSTDKGVDHRYLEGWNRFSIMAANAAVAAVFGRTRIRNPTGSNVIAVIEAATFFNNTTADTPVLTYGATVTDLATVVSLTFARLDPRGNPQPTCVVSTNPQAAGGTTFLQRSGPINTTIDFINSLDQQIPLLPGQVIDIQSQIANNACVAGFMWRERALESSELT